MGRGDDTVASTETEHLVEVSIFQTRRIFYIYLQHSRICNCKCHFSTQFTIMGRNGSFCINILTNILQNIVKFILSSRYLYLHYPLWFNFKINSLDMQSTVHLYHTGSTKYFGLPLQSSRLEEWSKTYSGSCASGLSLEGTKYNSETHLLQDQRDSRCSKVLNESPRISE